MNIYFVPANSVAPISGVVESVRKKLGEVGSVISATTDSRINEKAIESSDVTCVMAPRHGGLNVIVGRGVFEAVEASSDVGVISYLIDPDTLELLKVISFSEIKKTYKEWGSLKVRHNASKGDAGAAIREALLRTGDKPVQREDRSPGLGYLALALRLGIVSLR